MYQLDCNHCDVLVEGEAVEQAKRDAKTHLKENHAEDVLTNLKEQYTNVQCQNGCGYTVPIGVENVAGVECPECGHDNFPQLLDQYVFFRITANKP
ncbi:hypothetical protein [Halorussus aquaticus]|uniref:DUF1059 domain-containing protein n=1 Tax=Halorussus aquaticus TaxID=2953748 RepID=A0ABD5Q7K2_9EURY|nr:hypothetical protein [Halorussus aquaticus]